jgi:hypothetical protein
MIKVQQLCCSFVLGVSLAEAAPKVDMKPRAPWRLTEYLGLAHRNPDGLIREGQRLMDPDQLRISKVEASAAFEWQDRLALVSALTDFFDPVKVRRIQATHKAQARLLIQKAMHDDPSLVVRDGAVEAVRRIVRMQPGEAKLWKKSLEKAFLNPANVIGGEGLFIRETILTTLREANLRPSAETRKAALRDKNEGVRALLSRWETRSFGEIPKSKVSTFR